MSNPNNPYNLKAPIHYASHPPHASMGVNVPCPQCSAEMDMSLITTLRNPTTNEMVWRGCWACLERRLAPSTTGIDYATRVLLQRAYDALTQPSSWAETGAVVDALEAVLKDG